MSDPRRWIDDPSELDDIELRALQAARSASPPTDVRRDVWSALSARLPPSGDPGAPPASSADGGPPVGGELGAGATSAQATGATLAVLKSLAIGAGIGAAMSLGASWVSGGFSAKRMTGTAQSRPASTSQRLPITESGLQQARAQPEASPSPSPPPVTTGVAGARQLEHIPAPAAAPEPAASEPAAAPEASVAAFALAESAAGAARGRIEADTRAESRLVAAARNALRANDVTRALQLLEQARTRFPAGVLAQEREALSVEALVRSGQHVTARQRGEQFLRAFPASPHAARVQAALERAR